MEIKLPSGRSIGDGHPPFIVAEVGSNWASLADCLTSISMARACGADAVKFQLFDELSLYGLLSLTDATSPNSDIPIQELIDRGSIRWPYPGQMPIEWLPKLKEKADACNIEFMCSAFSHELIDAVNPHVNLHKVASAECTHLRMLERLRAIGKPVILSTGAHGAEDIKMALSILGPTPTVLMYCVAAYPAREVNLENIGCLRNAFGCLSGYSDHSVDVGTIPLASIQSGSAVLEKHFTAIPEHNTPDRDHSLEPSKFRRMVDSLRGKAAQALGPTPEEMPMILRHNRRLIATQDISHGTKFIEGTNFGIYRSLKDDTHAFHPFMIDEINGKTAKKDIAAGSGIGPGDV